MIKKILSYRLRFLQKAVLCFGLLMALGTTGAFAQFAVSEDFRGAGNPDIIIGDNAILTSGNGDPVNGGWLRLTNAAINRKGYAFVDKAFPSTLGVLVDFEYKTWRATSDGAYNGADGIGVFLFDGVYDQTTFALGGYGGSLGYAPNTNAGTSTGLKGGYVGIGLDEYGNFSNANEGRIGGPGARPNSVVLRGPTTASASTTNAYLSGTTITTTDGITFSYPSSATTGNSNQNALDYNTVPTARPTDAEFYRRIQIEIERLTTGGQYKITVRWKTTPNGAFTDITSYTTTTVPPSLLKLGFAAATGSGFNTHEIRNLLVTTPNNMRVKKTANKDFLRTIAGSNNDNLITYTIEVTNDTQFAVPNIDFVDRITDVDGTLLPKYNAVTTPNGFEIVSAVASGFTSGTPTIALLTNTITGTFSMAASSTGIITVVGRLRGYTPSGSRVINTATATPPYDEDLNNNTSVVKTPVLAEGIDFVPTHTVDENCADGSNTFTVNVANMGATPASVGNNNNSNRLTLTIRVPRTSQGYTYTVNTMAGWSYVDDENTTGNTRTYYYRSNQSATMSSGSAYNYPFIYTLTKTTPFTAYNTRATIAFVNDDGNNIESSGANGNNTEDVSIVVIPAAPAAPNAYRCLGETGVPLTATATSGNTLKWYFEEVGGFGSDYAPIPNTQNPGIVNYWVTQTNGSCEGPRTKINVYVAPTPTEGSIAADQYLCNGANDGAPLTSVTPGTVGTVPAGFTLVQSYKWQISTNNNTWNDIANTNSATYDPPAINGTRWYRRVTISTNTTGGGSYACFSPPTNVVIVAPTDVPTGGVISGPGRVCSGNTATLNNDLNGGASTVNYQWQSSTTGGPGFNWVDIPGAINASYTTGPLTARTWYRRLAVNQCGAGTTGDINVEVTTVNPGSLGANKTICPGTSPGTLGQGTGTANGSATAGGISYRWESAPGATGGTFTTIASQTAATYAPGNIASTIRYRRYTISTSGTVVCEAFVELLVTTQAPTAGSVAASQTICFGTQPGLFTSATGGAGTGPGTVTYQWQSSDNGSTNWNNINGATGETYQEPNTLTANKYYRRYTSANSDGTTCQSGNTNTITVTVAGQVNDPGSLTASNQYKCGGSAFDPITSQGAGSVPSPGTISYQWQSSTNSGTTWTDVSGATAANYTPTGTVTQNIMFRRLIVGNYSGTLCRSGWGPQISVWISPVATPGTIGSDQVVCNNTAPAQLTNVQSGNDTNGGYQWQYSTAVTPWTNISGATNAVYQPGAITVTTYYRRFGVSNNGGTLCTGTVASNTVTMTVPAVPVAGTIGSNQNVCGNAIPALLTSSDNGSGGTSYQWQESYDNSYWANLSGATSATYQPVALGSSRYFRRLNINNTCPSAPSNVVLITVNVYPNPGSITDNETVCAGNTPATITGDTGWPGGGTGTYRWYSSPDGTTWTYTGVTTQNYTFSAALASTTHYRRGLTSSPCFGEVYSNVVVKTVAAAPNGGAIQAAQTICSGTAPATLTSSTAGSTTNYRWEWSTNGAAPWTNANVTTADYSPGVLTTTTHFRRATISASCAGEAYSNVIIITVSPTPTGGAVTASQTVCAGVTPANLVSTDGGSGTNYRWQSSSDNISWNNTAVTTAGYTFSGALAATTYFRRASTAGSCSGYSNTITITVVAAATGGTIAASQTICYNAAPATLTSSAAGTGAGGFTYRWEWSPNGSAPWTNAGVTTADYSPGALTVTRHFRRVTIPVNGTCDAYSNVIIVSVAAQTTEGSISAGTQSICMDTAPALLGSTTVNLGTGSGTITYRWESSANGSTGWTVITGATGPTYQPPVLKKTTYYRRTTIATYTVSGNTATCESAPTGTAIVTTRNCKVITNPMIYQKVKTQ